jgi:hypothetical protein
MPDHKTYRTVDDGPDVVHVIRVPLPGERDDYITGLASLMARIGLPDQMLMQFAREAAARPGERPTITRTTNEVYPDPHSWEQQCRCYEPGILHWEWADGSGFPPKGSGDGR